VHQKHFQEIVAKLVNSLDNFKFQDNFRALLKFHEFQDSWDPCLFHFRLKTHLATTNCWYPTEWIAHSNEQSQHADLSLIIMHDLYLHKGF